MGGGDILKELKPAVYQGGQRERWERVIYLIDFVWSKGSL